MDNKRIYFFFIIYFFVFTKSYSTSNEIQNWIPHISYSGVITQIVQNKDKIYNLTDGKLFIYDRSDESLEEFIKYDGGNTDIKNITYSQKYKCLILTRNDANIELLYDDLSYINIADLKNSSLNIVKTINSIFINESDAYLATDFGFTIINLDKAEVKESGIFNIPFHSICIYENKLIASTANGILAADLNANLQDISNWTEFALSKLLKNQNYKFEDKEISNILNYEDQLYFIVPQKAIYILQTPELVEPIQMGSKPTSILKTGNNHLLVTEKTKLWDYTDKGHFTQLDMSDQIDSVTYIIPNEGKSNEYWLSATGNNLSLIKKNGDTFEFLNRYLHPVGPATNYIFSQEQQNKQLLITGGGFYNERDYKSASISILKKDYWSNIYQGQINQESGINAMDFGYAISDPLDPSHLFASSWGEGLYEFKDNKFVKRYDKTNSTIEELSRPDGFKATRVSGMIFDKNNNLWVLNSMVESIIKIYQKNGQWTKLFYPEIADRNTNPKNILIDKHSNKWITTFGEQDYIFVLNDNGTISNSADDKRLYVNTFKDGNNNSYFITDINGIAEDTNGSMWLSTNIGPFRTQNITSTFPTNLDFNRIKVKKDANSNVIITLLEDVPTNAIAIDGANRKWIATQNAGVYLLSTDNSTILEHFTIDNSPLPSNNILSLSIDPENGNVFFGSDRGLIAYKGKVTPASDSFSNIYVYPNPVRPDYSGVITVSGLKLNSHIKITDLRGNLIIEGSSLGGQFIWNGNNAKGKRVDTGVYLVFGSDQNNSESIVTKIMIVND